MSRVCSETCRPPFLSFIFFFILVKRIFWFVFFFFLIMFIFFCFFLFLYWFLFCHSHLETENRGSRALYQSSVVEKRRETEGRTDDETRYTPSWVKFYLHSIFVSMVSKIFYNALEKLCVFYLHILNIPNHFENLYISKNLIFEHKKFNIWIFKKLE